MWDESIDSNIASHATAAANDFYSGVVHALDYSVYAHLQLGQDAAAARLVDELLEVGEAHPSNYNVLAHLADIKARDVFERRAWSEAVALDLEPNLGQFARFEATVLFARWPGTASCWHVDLRRAAAYGPALGKFVTLHDYFADTDMPDMLSRFEADEYPISGLKRRDR